MHKMPDSIQQLVHVRSNTHIHTHAYTLRRARAERILVSGNYDIKRKRFYVASLCVLYIENEIRFFSIILFSHVHAEIQSRWKQVKFWWDLVYSLAKWWQVTTMSTMLMMFMMISIWSKLTQLRFFNSSDEKKKHFNLLTRLAYGCVHDFVGTINPIF